ncbi:MAG: efflux RND transporter periplasmic adaptor subunit, partial [Geminicoccaceae bacterium]
MRRAILPVMILALGALAAWFIPMKRPASEVEPPIAAAPIVSVIVAQPQDLALSVTAHGIVTPRTEIDLVAEVQGKLIYAAPTFVAGGFFAKDDLLLSIDPRDYELAVVRAEAAVAEARQNLKREQAEADLAAEEWQTLGGGRDASP